MRNKIAALSAAVMTRGTFTALSAFAFAVAAVVLAIAPHMTFD